MKIAIIFFIVVIGFSVAAYLGSRQKQKRLNNEDKQK
jgi:hypothetical protein